MCWYPDFSSGKFHPAQELKQLHEWNTAPAVGWLFQVRGVGHALVTLLTSTGGPYGGPATLYSQSSAWYTRRPGRRSPVVSNRMNVRPVSVPAPTHRPVLEEKS
jgi:hypothetical protein